MDQDVGESLMPNDPNTKDFEEFTKIAEAHQVRTTAIGTDLLDHFKRDAFDLTTMAAWFDKQRELRPHLFVSKDDDLETLAFEKQNITARSRLFTKLGEVAFNERAAAWGLGPNNFGKGTRPDGEPKKNGADNDEANPFSAKGWSISKQGALVKSLGETKALEIARRVGITKLGQTRPVQ
jgi:hypothetical protein